MQAKPVTYIVRIWREPEPFRAEVRMVQAEESRRFETPEALLAYLTGDGLESEALGAKARHRSRARDQ